MICSSLGVWGEWVSPRESSRFNFARSSPGLARRSMLGLFRTSSVRSTGVSLAERCEVKRDTGVVALGMLERGVTEPKPVSAACAKGFVSGMRAGVGIPCGGLSSALS